MKNQIAQLWKKLGVEQVYLSSGTIHDLKDGWEIGGEVPSGFGAAVRVGIRFELGMVSRREVNWAACGDVAPINARQYAEAITKSADAVDRACSLLDNPPSTKEKA